MGVDVDLRAYRKRKTREAIIAAAVELVRRRGVSAASVGAVMARAGLTVGGFYAHFRSKQELATTAIRRAFSEHREALFNGIAEHNSAERYDLAVRRYLSRQHRDFKNIGCPLPACLTDAATESGPIRDAISDGVNELTKQLLPLFVDNDKLTSRQRALATTAALVGALAIARATAGSDLSDEVLLATRKLLFEIKGKRS